MEPEVLRQKVEGIYTIFITPFKENFELDLEGASKLTEHVIQNGVHGIIVCGSLGEMSSLTLEERRKMFQTVISTSAGRVPVIATTSHSNPDEALELTEFAQKIGADGVMMTAPYYCAPSERGIFEFFSMISEKTNIGIMLYNTSRAGVNLSPKFIDKLADIPNVVAIKQGTRNITEQEETIALCKDKIAILCGSEEMMLPLLSMGHVGSSSNSSCFMPQIMVETYNATSRGDYNEARRLFFKWQAYRRFGKKKGQPASTKAAMNIMGLPAGPVRLPMISLTDEDKIELKDILGDMGVL